MKEILNTPGFSARTVDLFESADSDDLSRFEVEGGSRAPEEAVEWSDVPLEHRLWGRNHRLADEIKSGNP